MKRILFITSTRLGDAVLSTGILSHLIAMHPDARITLVCGPLPASIFAGIPQLNRLIILKKQRYKKHWIDLWQQVVGTRWDIVVDLRNSLVSRLIRSKKLYHHDAEINHDLNKVEQNAHVVKLDGLYDRVPAPRLWLTEAQTTQARLLIPDGGPVIGVGPTANWIGKTWPAERFSEVIRFMTAPTGPFPQARVAVFAAPGEETTAYEVYQSIPEEARIDVIAKADPGTAAAAVARCAFYLGNDSGLMHCAAAAGVPTLGLFGPSYANIYAPWGPHAAYVRTPETFDQLIAFPGYNPKTLTRSLMTTLSVEAVIAAIKKHPLNAGA